MLPFCADPVRIMRLASVATDSSNCPAKNAAAVWIVAKTSAMKGAATIANSSAAAPSSRRAKPATDAGPLRLAAGLLLKIVHITEDSNSFRSVFRCSKQALRKCCAPLRVDWMQIDVLPTMPEGREHAVRTRCGALLQADMVNVW